MRSRRILLSIMLLVACNKTIMAGQEVSGGGPDKVTTIHGYLRLAAAIAQQSYQFFVHDAKEYDLQEDVLNVPYKNMVYASTESIEQAFNNANRHDNPQAQIKALIALCRLPVCEWYLKSFQKGLDQLYATCFDEAGNFKDAANLGDIRVVFKDYCKKAPTCWQDIAKISMWWCKNKQPHAMHTKDLSLNSNFIKNNE